MEDDDGGIPGEIWSVINNKLLFACSIMTLTNNYRYDSILKLAYKKGQFKSSIKSASHHPIKIISQQTSQKSKPKIFFGISGGEKKKPNFWSFCLGALILSWLLWVGLISKVKNIIRAAIVN